MGKRFDVFVSHSSVDKLWALRLVADLGRYGVSVWLDENEIRPGDLFVNALERGWRRAAPWPSQNICKRPRA
jgi:TIR domain